MTRNPLSRPRFVAANLSDLEQSRPELVVSLNPKLRAFVESQGKLPDDLKPYDNCIVVVVANINHSPEQDLPDREYGIKLFDYTGSVDCRIPDRLDRIANRFFSGVNLNYDGYRNMAWSAREVTLKWWMYHEPEEAIIHRSDFELVFVRNFPKYSTVGSPIETRMPRGFALA